MDRPQAALAGALHLAAFAIVRREIEDLEFLIADRRLETAAEAV